MTHNLTQVSKRTGVIARVPRGRTPVVELRLEENQYVVSCTLEPLDRFSLRASERKTVDWSWTAMVASRL